MRIIAWKKRWLWWLLGSMLIAAVAPVLAALLDAGNSEAGNKGGIHMRAYGFFFASNVVVIDNSAPQK